LAQRKRLDRVRERHPRNRQQIVSFLQTLAIKGNCLRSVCRVLT
jgi:hypothetical protein